MNSIGMMSWKIFSTVVVNKRPIRAPLVLLGLVWLVLACAGPVEASAPLTIFGPQRYELLEGGHNIFTTRFARCEPSSSALLKITNGKEKTTRIRSARILVNGDKVAGEHNFKAKVANFEKSLTVNRDNELKVDLKGGRHGYLDRIASLQAGLAATEADFTVMETMLVTWQAALVAGQNLEDDEVRHLVRRIAGRERGGEKEEDRQKGERHHDHQGHDDSHDDDVNSGWSLSSHYRQRLSSARSILADILSRLEGLRNSGNDRTEHEENNHFESRGHDGDAKPDEVTRRRPGKNRNQGGDYDHDDLPREKARHEQDRTDRRDNKEAADQDGEDRFEKNLTASLATLDQLLFATVAHMERLGGQLEQLKARGPAFIVIEIIGQGCDVTPPIISAPQPADGALLATARPAVQASYADESQGAGIDPASVRLTLDGADVTAAASVTAEGISYLPAGPLAEGEHILSLSVADLAANTAERSWRFTTDTIAPVIEVTSHEDGAWLNTQVVTVAGNLDDPTANVTVNGVPATVGSAGFSLPDFHLAEGKNPLTIVATDPAGNATRHNRILQLDTVSPAVTIETPADDLLTNIPQIDVTAGADEPVRAAVVNGQAATIVGQSVHLAGLPLAEGENTVSITITDRAGNEGSAAVTVRLDTAPPEAPLLDAPASPTNQEDFILTGRAEPGSSVQLLAQAPGVADFIPFATVSADTAGQFTRAGVALAEGVNAFTAVATDAAGNEGPQAAAVSVQRDTAAPTIGAGTPADGALLSTAVPQLSAAVADEADGSGIDPTRVQLVLDGTDVTASANIGTEAIAFQPAQPLPEGGHSALLTVGDRAGNLTQRAWSFTTDTVPPTPSLASHSDGVFLKTPDIALSGMVDDPAATVTINDVSVPADAEGFRLSDFPLAEGPNIVTVRAVDEAGNVGSITLTIHLDTRPPVVTVAAPLAGSWLNTPQIEVRGQVDETLIGLTVNGAPASHAGGSFSLAGLDLSEGNNTVEVVAIDRAGNAGSLRVPVHLDTLPPQPTLTAPVSGLLTNTPNIDVTGYADEPLLTAEVNGSTAAIDGGNFTLADFPLQEGNNTLTVTARDRAGNPATAAATVVLDTLPPAAPVFDPVPSPSNNLGLDLAGVAEPGATVRLFAVTDNGEIPLGVAGADSDGHFVLSGIDLNEGRNRFGAVAVDAAGNQGPAAAPLEVVRDTIPPRIVVTAPAAGTLTSAAQIDVLGSVDEAVAAVSVDGLAAALNGLEFTLGAVPLQEGSNTLQLVAVDLAGNSADATLTLVRDSIPPAPPQLDPIASPTNVATAALSGTAEPGARVSVSVARPDGSEEALATLTAAADGAFALADVALAEGENRFFAVATDAAGNAGEAATASVRLDTVAPTIAVASPADGSVSDLLDIVVTGTVDEADAQLTVDGVAVPLAAGVFSHPLTLQPGSNTLILLATDPAGNTGTTSLTVQADGTPPTVTIAAPASGSLTSLATTTLSGSVDEEIVALALNGQAVPFSGRRFSIPAALAEGENQLRVAATDRAGNVGSAAVTVIRDSQPPQLDLTGPAEADAGTSVQLQLSAADVSPLNLVELRSGTVVVWSGGGDGMADLAQSVSFSLPPELAAGEVVTLRAAAIDAAGNRGEATLTLSVANGASGPGYLQGEVYDDSRGLRLAEAEVRVLAGGVGVGVASTLSDGDGGYFFELPAGDYLLRLSKAGYTGVERQVTVQPSLNLQVRDARLTPQSGAPQRFGPAGGVLRRALGNSADAPALELEIPADILSESVDLRLLPLSNQGLPAPLPLGWAPLAACEVRAYLPDTTEPAPAASAALAGATLRVPLSATLQLDADSRLLLAAYDNADHTWNAAGSVVLDADQATVQTTLPGGGVFALLLADATAEAPPATSLGQSLAGSAAVAFDPAAVTASGRVVPYAAPARQGLLAAGEVTLAGSGPGALLSGTVLTGKVLEYFDLASGETLQPAEYRQDLTFYRAPCLTNIGGGALDPNGADLRSTFPVSPSREFTVADLLQGKVGIEILPSAGGGSGVMVGPDGARLVDADGNVLEIPAGALAATVPVQSSSLASADAPVGADLVLLRAVEIDLTGQRLVSSATLSIPAPAGLDAALPLLLARQIDVAGSPKLKLVGNARLSGSMVVSSPRLQTKAATQTLPGVITSGRYYLLQARGPLGYLRGTVNGGAGSPFAGALVAGDTCSLVDLTGSDGRYLVPLGVGAFTASALDPALQDGGSAGGTIPAPGALLDLDLTIRPVPPQVTGIVPADGAGGVEPNVAPRLSFSEPLDRASVDQTALRLLDGGGLPVAGALSFNPDGSEVTFYPAANLASETTYTLSLAGTVRDRQGYPLGQPLTSSFTVRDTTPPPMPPAGSIAATFPDAEGLITVTGTQGSVELGATVLVINDTSGEIVGVSPATDGSFTARISAQLGDQIQVVMMDAAGNQTLISYLTFKSEDGRYLVTAKGGKVEGEGGSRLVIPDGALVGPAVVKLTQVAQADLPHPVPAEAAFIAAVNLDSGGIPFRKEVKLSIPAPADLPADATFFVAQPRLHVNADGSEEEVYVIVDSAKLQDGRLTTASPPFNGIHGFGTFCFLTARPAIGPVIVSGTTYRDLDGNPGYLAGVDRPIEGAVIRSPGAWNFIAYSDAKGHYAAYGFTAAGACRNFSVTAIHPLTMFRGEASLTACDAPYIVNNLNFKLADAQTEVPDETAPVVEMGLAVAPGQDAGFAAGTIQTGTDLAVTVGVIDQELQQVNLHVSFTPPDGSGGLSYPMSFTRQGAPAIHTPQDGEKPALLHFDYQPTFVSPLAGSRPEFFRPGQPGRYLLTVEAVDAAGNTGRKTLQVRAVTPGDTPASYDGPPLVDSLEPGNGSQGNPITTVVKAVFSEPVRNVTKETFQLIDDGTGQPVPAEVHVRVVDGRMEAVLQPKRNLEFGGIYLAVLTQGITDQQPNPSAGGQLLPLAEVYGNRFTTQIPQGYDLDSGSFSDGWDVALYDDLLNGRQYAYVSAKQTGLRVIDVTDPAHPAVVFAKQPEGAAWSMRGVAVDQQSGVLAVTEDIRFSSGGQYGYVRFYDLHGDPANPRLFAQEKLAEAFTGIPGKVALAGGYAYIATVGAGLQVVDIEAARNHGGTSDGSTIVGIFDTLGQGYNQPVDIGIYAADRAYLTTTSGTLLLLDLSTPNLPRLLSAYKPAGTTTMRIAVAGNYLFNDANGVPQTFDLAVAATREGELVTLDITDPFNVRLLGRGADQDGEPALVLATDIALDVEHGLAFVSGFNDIQIFDLKNPAQPLLVHKMISLQNLNKGKVPLGRTNAMQVLDGIIYAANQLDGFKVVEVAPIDKRRLPYNPCGVDKCWLQGFFK